MELNDFLEELYSSSTTIFAHTSGSTGKPKPILLMKDDLWRSARASNTKFGIGPKSVLFCPLSMDYIAGKMMVVRAMAARCKLIIDEPSNEIRLPEDTFVDLIAIVPTQIDSLLKYDNLSERLRTVLIGGAPATKEHCKALLDKGIQVYLSYGMTETCSHVALADASEGELIYRAMPGIWFETDDTGRLIIEAPQFSFGRIIANDIVELVDERSFRWLGRSDSVINSGGLKFIPEVLEAEYKAVLGDRLYYVTSEPSEKWGEAVVLVIEGDDSDCEDAQTLLSESGIDHRRLPKRIVAVERIERNERGKLKRVLPSDV